MKISSKKAYMIPETDILSLESQGATMTNPASQFGHTDPNVNSGTSFHAPERKVF